MLALCEVQAQGCDAQEKGHRSRITAQLSVRRVTAWTPHFTRKTERGPRLELGIRRSSSGPEAR